MARGIFLRINDESEIAVVGTPHGAVFARSIRRVPKEDSGDGLLFNSIKEVPWELQPGVEREVVNRVQVDVRAAIPERPPTTGEQLPRRVCRRSVELATYGYTRCIGCQHARLGLKPADHSEECRARIVRHVTADDDLNKRVHIVQDRIVETAPPEARTGERDSVPEPVRKKVRFAERVEAQTPEGAVVTTSRSTSSRSSSSSSSSSTSSPTEIATPMQVDESDQDRSKRQKVTHATDMELEELITESELDRLQRFSDCDFLMQVKQDADAYLDRIVYKDCKVREAVKKDLLQLGVHPSVRGGSVFKSWKGAVCPQIWSDPWICLGSENRMGLERPCPTCKNMVTFATRKADFDCWKLEWTWCQDDAYEVDV